MKIRKSNWMRTVLMAFVSVVAMAQLNCTGRSEGSEDNRSDKLIPAVEAVKARLGVLPLVERLTGVVLAKNQIEIYPEIGALIVSVQAKNGDLVKKGQTLIRLRDKEFSDRLKQARAGYQISVAQAKQAEARLKEIQASLERTRTLAEKDLASDTDLEAIQTRAVSAEADVELAQARVDQAQATVDEREEALTQTVIRAPVSGTIGNRNAEVGMSVNTGTRLYTLGKLDSVRVEIVLTDLMLEYIETGQRTEIFAGGSYYDVITSSLSRISPFLHPVTHSTDAEIELENTDGRLKPGMFVSVDVHYGESDQATQIPLSALYENPATGGTGVYVAETSLGLETIEVANTGESIPLTEPIGFKFVPVDVVAKGRMEAGIRGIEPGDWVVTIGQDLLAAGSGKARVRAVKWERVQQLQNLKREDLLQEVMRRQQLAGKDTTALNQQNSKSE